MKKIPLLFFAVSSVFLFTLDALAGATLAQMKFQKIYSDTQKVNECRGNNTSPLTFGPKDGRFSLMTFAKLGSVMVGNDLTAFKLSADKGTLEIYDGKKQKWSRFTYVIDAKAFLEKLKQMGSFLDIALEVAQKEKDENYAEKVTCSSKIIEITQTEYKKPSV